MFTYRSFFNTRVPYEQLFVVQAHSTVAAGNIVANIKLQCFSSHIRADVADIVRTNNISNKYD